MPIELATLLEVCGVSLLLLLAVIGLAIRHHHLARVALQYRYR